MPRTRQAPKKLTASHLSEIDNLSKRDAHKGEMAQFCAWQYLRMESLCLGLRLESKKLDPHQEAALVRVRAELFYWIDRGPNPEGGIVFQGMVPLHARRGLSVFRLPDGQPHRYPNRFALSLDPGQEIELLLEKVREEIVAERKRRRIRNAKGQGKSMGLRRMWKALAVYKKALTTKQRQTKQSYVWWDKIPGINKENTAHKFTSLAKKMVTAAMSETWEEAFPLR